MTQFIKKVEKFLKNPTSAKYSDLESILIHFGFEKINAKGSHVKFKHPKLRQDLIIPIHKNECKSFYKEQAKKIIKKLKPYDIS